MHAPGDRGIYERGRTGGKGRPRQVNAKMNIAQIIEGLPLFQGLPAKQQQNIARIALIKTYPKNSTIFTEGDNATGFFIAHQGRVKVFKLSSEGKEQILHIIAEGEPFGEVAVFTGSTFPAHAEAIDECKVIFIPRQSFVDLITVDPSLSMNMLAILSRRLKQFTFMVENLSLKEVPQRLASFLLESSREKEGATEVRLAITKGQLASLLGTIPETLSRILNKMIVQDVIGVKGRVITIRDRGTLEEIATSSKFLV